MDSKMKAWHGFFLFIALIGMMLFAFWMGIGMGLMACAAHPKGYDNGYFKDGFKAYCEIRK
jgi:hypothetical protein